MENLGDIVEVALFDWYAGLIVKRLAQWVFTAFLVAFWPAQIWG